MNEDMRRLWHAFVEVCQILNSIEKCGIIEIIEMRCITLHSNFEHKTCHAITLTIASVRARRIGVLSGQKMKEGGTEERKEGEAGARGEGNLMNERARTNYRANKDEIEEINADCTDVQTDQEWNGEGSDIIGAGCCPLLLRRGGDPFYLRRGTSTQVNGSQTFIERS